MPATTDYEYALLSKMATNRERIKYYNLGAADKTLHQQRAATLAELGWIECSTSEDLHEQRHGYYGVAYYKIDPVTQTAEMVIAHRGTCLSNIDPYGNIVADIEIAKQQEPKILREAAFRYVNKLFNHDFYASDLTQTFEINGYPITKITHTGFSLGGIIAGASAAMSNTPMHAVTFDAPGIGSLDIDRTAIADRITNIVTVPNIVNTCNQHVGKIKQLTTYAGNTDLEVDYEMEFNNLGLMEEEPAYLDYNRFADEKYLEQRRKIDQKKEWSTLAAMDAAIALETHDLNKIIAELEGKQPSAVLRSVFKWPTAKTEMIYGPKQFTSISTFGFNDGWNTLASLAAVTAQFVKGGVANILWDISQRENQNGELEGIIGVKHQRSFKIYYSQDQYFYEGLIKMARPLMKALQQLSNLKPSVTISTDAKQSMLDTKHSAAPSAAPDQKAFTFNLPASAAQQKSSPVPKQQVRTTTNAKDIKGAAAPAYRPR